MKHNWLIVLALMLVSTIVIGADAVEDSNIGPAGVIVMKSGLTGILAFAVGFIGIQLTRDDEIPISIALPLAIMTIGGLITFVICLFTAIWI